MKTCKVKVGNKYGKLEVIKLLREEKYASGQKKYVWLCKCDCGETCEKDNSMLLSAKMPSCGCQKLHYKTHSMTHTRIYNIWSNMKTRCYAKSCLSKTYQKRNIKVCDEWKNSFIAFYNWSMQNGYKDNLSIDRIDNSGDYEPNNCRWTDKITQENNTSKNVLVLINGEVHTLAEWGRIMNISPKRIKRRVENGWYCRVTKEEALEWR